MKLINNNKFFFLTLLGIFTIFGIQWKPNKINQLSAKSFFLQPLAQEEALIWQDFATLGIDKKKFETTYENYLANNTADPVSQKQVSAETKKLVEQILQENNIDLNKVAILGWDQDTAAAATRSALYINEKLFNDLDPISKRFVLSHESTHIKEKDSSSKHVLGSMLGIDVPTACDKDLNHPLCRLSRLHEKRADIVAATQNKEIAQGYLTFMAQEMATRGEKGGRSHPSNSDRLALAQQIVDYFNWANPQTA